MKPKKLISAVLAAIACTALIPTISSAQTDPVFPTGTLSATPRIVFPGVYPILTWDITYPETVIDVIDIVPPGVIIPKEDLYMDVRVLGASIEAGAGNWLNVQAWIRADGSGSWSNFFYGKQPDVNPTNIYYTKFIRKNLANHFGARYYNNGWARFYSTSSGSYTSNITALINGDRPPSYTPLYNQQNIEAFLDPYLDSDGKVDIGPMDVIILMELGTSNTGSSAFDMQDLVLLVTFRRVTTP